MGKQKQKKRKAEKVPVDAKTTSTSAVTDQQKVEAEEDAKGRDFSGDLNVYLQGWEQKETEAWKFNKVLQAWALSNVFDNKKIDSSLFKRLCPYLQSVQGGAKMRLLEQAVKITEEEDTTENSDEESIISKKKKRAKKIAKLLKSK